jgi:hypothetical protein
MKFFFAHVVGDVGATGRSAYEGFDQQPGGMAQGSSLSAGILLSGARV